MNKKKQTFVCIDKEKNKRKTMQNIGPMKRWFELETFCNKKDVKVPRRQH